MAISAATNGIESASVMIYPFIFMFNQTFGGGDYGSPRYQFIGNGLLIHLTYDGQYKGL